MNAVTSKAWGTKCLKPDDHCTGKPLDVSAGLSSTSR